VAQPLLPFTHVNGNPTGAAAPGAARLLLGTGALLLGFLLLELQLLLLLEPLSISEDSRCFCFELAKLSVTPASALAAPWTSSVSVFLQPVLKPMHGTQSEGILESMLLSFTFSCLQ